MGVACNLPQNVNTLETFGDNELLKWYRTNCHRIMTVVELGDLKHAHTRAAISAFSVVVHH